jgi:ATP-binding cassette subfamily B multidrug efflux pump
MQRGFGYFEEDQLGQVGDFGLWRRIFVYVAPYRRSVAVAILLSLLVVGASLALPYLLRLGVDHYIVNAKPPVAARLSGLARIAGLFVAVMLTGFLANFAQVTLLEWTGQSIMHGMRQDLFSHLLALDVAFFSRQPVGKLVTRLTNDIQNMREMFTSVIVTLFNDFIRLGGILLILFWMDWRLALALSLFIPLILVNMTWFNRMAREAFRAIRTHLARINAFLQESLSGMIVIQLFLRERDTERRFAALNQTFFEKALHQIKIFGAFMPFIETLNIFSTGVIIWYGGTEILRDRMTIGILVAFLSYMRLFFQPMRELSQKYSIIQSAMASAERLFQLLDTRSALTLPTSPLKPPEVRGKLVLDRVSFAYDPEQPVIRELSLSIAPGETVAIVGPTGAGKTTIINLLERFYDPEQGGIYLDDIEISRLDPHWLRRQIGLVMQEVYIMPASVRENILLDRQLSDGDLEYILREAQLAETVARLPDGWDTFIGEGGIELSTGQRQLLAFARVLARDPRILVLDEATANVDSETEQRIERAIATALAGRTSLVIAHRLSTIRRADRIVVMEKGRIIEQGTHKELMTRAGLYSHLQQLQGNNSTLPH